MKEMNGSIWHTMSTRRVTPTDFICVIEISKGSKNKYEMDKENPCSLCIRFLFNWNIEVHWIRYFI